MAALTYILYSPSIDRYYIGMTTGPMEDRLDKHNSGYYEAKWTARGIPWKIFLVIECECEQQAASIEKHIKKMKSRNYILNLSKFPEMIDKLKTRFHEPDC